MKSEIFFKELATLLAFSQVLKCCLKSLWQFVNVFPKTLAFTKQGEELKDNRKCGCTTSISFTLQFYRERDYDPL